MTRLAPLICAIWAVAFAASPAAAAPPIWIVHDADSTIVLFGSIHILPVGVQWAPKPLTDAVTTADDLWFEIPVDAYSSLEASQQAAAHAMLPLGQTLSPLLDPASLARLKILAARLNLPMAELDQLQPWMAEVRLSVRFLEKRGGLVDQGVEEQVAAMAPPTARRRAFETATQQIAILSGDDLDTQLVSLKQTLRDLDDDPGGYNRLLKAWLAGDAKRLDEEVIEPMRKTTPKSYESLVVNRNRAWCDIIEKRLAGSGRTVMVVGAGHLVGPDSVPAMLRARGVQVDGP